MGRMVANKVKIRVKQKCHECVKVVSEDLMLVLKWKSARRKYVSLAPVHLWLA